jgi:hypothetical protein
LNGELFKTSGTYGSFFDIFYDLTDHAIELKYNQGGGGGATPEPKFVLLDLALAGILVAWKSRRKKETSL